MERRSFVKLLTQSILLALGLISLDSCVVYDRGAVPGVVRRGRRRRIRRRIRRRARRRAIIGGGVIFILPKATRVGEEIELPDGSVGVVQKINGQKVDIESNGQIQSLSAEFE